MTHRIKYTLFAFAITCQLFASDVKIDKDNCTITKDGKTYKLYGKVKIVDSFEAENREELFKSLAGKGITPIRVEMSKGRRGAATASADRKRTSSGTHTSYKLVVYALCLILAGALFLILYLSSPSFTLKSFFSMLQIHLRIDHLFYR